MKKCLFLLFLAAPFWVFSQNCNEKIEAARYSMKKGDYRKALAQFTAAANSCGEDKRAEIDMEILNIFDQIEKQRSDADAAKKKAAEEGKKAKYAAEEEKKAKITVQIALDSLNKTIEVNVRLILADAIRNQKERNFNAAVDKIQTARNLGALRDSVQWASRQISLALFEDFREKLDTQDFKMAAYDILLASKLNSLPDSVDIMRRQLIDILIEHAESGISKADYTSAIENAHILYTLQVTSVRLSSIYMEIAFCLASDTGQTSRSAGLLDTAAQIRNNPSIMENLRKSRQEQINLGRRDLLSICEQLDSLGYRDLMQRYYPDLLISIPAGQLTLRDRESKSPNSCKVPVSPFLLSSHEVTFFEYYLFCVATHRPQPSDNGWGGSDRPVTNVSWFDALKFCNWRSLQEGLQPVYLIDSGDTNRIVFNPQANGYRLPLETEWAFAAGNGEKQTLYSWGNEVPAEKAGGNVADESVLVHFPEWRIFSGYSDGYPYTAPVGKFQPNDFGVFDLTGNVWEWCWDEFKESNCEMEPLLDLSNHVEKVLRGGSWGSLPSDCIIDKRFHSKPEHWNFTIGFRLAKNTN